MGLSIAHGIGIPFKKNSFSWSRYWDTLISATVEDTAPYDFVLTFLVARPSLGIDDFIIAGHSLTNAVWAGAVLTLTSSVEVVYGDTPVITFVPSGGTANITNNVIQWYLKGNVASANAKGVYSPEGAASLLSSYINLISPGINDVAPGTAPAWDTVNGWKFNGIDQYLVTGIIPVNDQTWSMIVKFSEFTSGDDTIVGLYEAANKTFRISNNSAVDKLVLDNGSSSSKSPVLSQGVACIAGKKGYRNGGLEGTITVGAGAITYDIWIGQVHYSSPSGFYDGNIQLLAIYNAILTPLQVLGVTHAMNNNYGQYTLSRRYVNNNFGALICFDQASFRTSAFEIGETNGNVNTFAPTGLDIDNWLDACVAAGMTYAIFTTKHHAGFKMWDTVSKVGANPVYGINSTTWYVENGSPDIVGLFVAGCRSRGLKVGLYYSIWDTTWEAQTGTTETDNAAGYLAMIEAELTELLTNYGVIDNIWLDGYKWHLGYEEIPFKTIYNFIKALQSKCIVTDNSHVFPDLVSQIEIREIYTGGDPVTPLGNIRPTEEVMPMRDDEKWFYHSDSGQNESDFLTATAVKSAQTQANDRNATLLLGLIVGTDGRLPSAQVAILEEIGTL